MVDTALAAAAVRALSSTSGTAAAAARASAFDPDFGAVFRTVFAGGLGVEAEAAVFRFAGALRVVPAELRFAGAFRVDPLDLADEAEVRLAAGFLRVEPERLEDADFVRLLGFLGVAMPTHYSRVREIRRRLGS